jgi:hypothetical protein
MPVYLKTLYKPVKQPIIYAYCSDPALGSVSFVKRDVDGIQLNYSAESVYQYYSNDYAEENGCAPMYIGIKDMVIESFDNVYLWWYDASNIYYQYNYGTEYSVTEVNGEYIIRFADGCYPETVTQMNIAFQI